MKFLFKPIIYFNDTTETGVDRIPINSYVHIIDSGNSKKLLYVTSVSGLTSSSTVSDLLDSTSNYIDILTDGIFSNYNNNLSDDIAPVLGGNLDGQNKEIQEVVLDNISYKIQDTSSIEYYSNPDYYVDLDNTNTYYCDIGSAGHSITFKLSPTTTIIHSKEITLILKNDTSYSVSFDSGSDNIIWNRNVTIGLGLNETYIIKFNRRASGDWFGRYENTKYIDDSWDIYKQTYTFYSHSSQDSGPTGLFFKPDGTKLYELGNSDAKFYEHSLSTAWDLSTITLDTTGTSTQDSKPTGIFLKPDGTKLYEVGYTNDKFYEHSLSTAWDLSSITLDTTGTSTADTTPTGLFFKPDGTKLYEVGSDSDKFYEHSLSTPWDLSTITLDTTGTSTADAFPQGLFFKPDGTKLYEAGTDSNKLYEHTLSTPWDLSTITLDTTGISSRASDPNGLFFKPDGTKLYEVGYEGKFYEHQLSY